MRDASNVNTVHSDAAHDACTAWRLNCAPRLAHGLDSLSDLAAAVRSVYASHTRSAIASQDVSIDSSRRYAMPPYQRVS